MGDPSLQIHDSGASSDGEAIGHLMTGATTQPNAVVSQLNRLVRRDSIWILLGYAITSGSGFAFWVLAARLIPAAELGIETAIYSVFTAAAGIATAGLGDALLVMLPVAGADAARLLKLGLGLAVGIAAAAGVIAGILVVQLVGGVPWIVIPVMTAVTVGWALFVVKDPVLQALGRANRTVVVNASSNLAKVALLPILVVGVTSINRPAVVSILVPVLIATAVAWTLVIPRSFRNSERITTSSRVKSADWAGLRRRFLVFALRDGSASGIYLATFLSVPYLVTSLGGPAEGALLAICGQLVTVLDLVALAVGASFSTHAATDRHHGAGTVVRLWLRVLAIVAPSAAALALLSPLILWVFGDEYLHRNGVLVMCLLAIGSTLRTSYEIWGASLRARQASAMLVVTSVLHAIVLFPLAVLLVPQLGAVGAALAQLGAALVLSGIGLVGLIRAGRRVAGQRAVVA